MIKNYDYLCIECHHEINNPICPSCILREIKAFAFAKINGNVEIDERKIKNINIDEGVRCIICKKIFDLCQYCFIRSLPKKISKLAKKIYKE